MAFPTLASIETAYNFLITGQAEPLLHNLRLLIQEAQKLLRELCTRENAPADVLRVGRENPRSPIIPIFTSHARSLADYCQVRGFMVRPIVAPTVPKGHDRVRVCLHAANTMSEVHGLVKTVGAWLAAWRTGTLTKVEPLRQIEPEGQITTNSGTSVDSKARL